MLKDILKSAGLDALKYFPVRLVPALTSLVTVPVFTRMVARADYGDFYLVNSAVSLAGTVFTTWLNASIVRFYWADEREGGLDEYVATVVWSATASVLIGAAVVGVIMTLLAERLSPGVSRLLPIALAGLLSGQFIQVMQQLMRAANRANAFAVLSIASTLVATALSVFFVVVPRWGALGILAGVALGNVLLIPSALKAARVEGSLSPRHFSAKTARRFAEYGIPMIPAAVSSWVLVLSDRYIIGLSHRADQVGLYGTAYNLGDKLMNLVMLPMLIAIGPVMVRTFEKQGQELAQKVQTQLTRYFVIVTAPLVAGLTVIARPFMQVMTGPQYRSAYPVLPVVAAGVMLYGLSQIAGNGLAMHKKTVILMQNMLAAAAFQVSANLVLVPRYGYPVAAWTTLLSYALLLLLAWLRTRPYMAWYVPWADLARVVAAASAMAAVLVASFGWFEPTIPLLLCEAVLGVAVYAVALKAVGALRPDEVAFAGEVWETARRRLRRVTRRF